jgi:two-component sensor histidine kinase
MIIPPNRQDEEKVILRRIRSGEHIAHYETVRLRKDGSLVEISLTVSPIRAADGTIIGASKIARDITERRQAEERQQLLLNEIKHRGKNTAAAIQAIALQTFRNASAEERDAFCGRLRAYSDAHELLSHENWSQAQLRDVAARAVQPFQDHDSKRIEMHGPDVLLDASQSTTVTMALHELATNATKYGALSSATGRISVRWKVSSLAGQRWLKLRWRETGGPAVKAPERKGFGSFLIERALVGGRGRTRVRFVPQGLIFVAEIPV